MAPLFSEKDIFGGLKRKQTFQSSTNLNNLLRFQYDAATEARVMRRLEQGINRASEEIAIELKRALDDAMQSPVWPRLNGPDSDIVDEGRLMASGRVLVTPKGLSIQYTAPYATLVHYGGYVFAYGNQSSRVYLPPRPWIEAVLTGNGPVDQFDFVSYYERYISAAFNS
jgi:hypothetical protein